MGHNVINSDPSEGNLAPSTICLGGKNSLPSLQLDLTYSVSPLGGRSRYRAHGEDIFCPPRAHCHIVCRQGGTES